MIKSQDIDNRSYLHYSYLRWMLALAIPVELASRFSLTISLESATILRKSLETNEVANRILRFSKKRSDIYFVTNIGTSLALAVELWIELNSRVRHVELKLEKYFFGFWPDFDMRYPVEGINRGPDSNPVSGGWRGKLIKSSEEKRASAYLFQQEMQPDDFDGYPCFRVYSIPTGDQAYKLLEDYLTVAPERLPEYRLRGRSSACNCVTFTINGLISSKVLSPDAFTYPRSANPKTLDRDISRYKATHPEVEIYDAIVQPPRFDKRIVV